MKNILIITMLLGVGYGQDCSENMSYSLCGSAFECNPSCLNPEGTIWCDNMCYEGCFCNFGYVFSDGNYDTCILLEDCFNDWEDGDCPPAGDMNEDGSLNVLDVVYIVNCILFPSSCPNNSCLGDTNLDGVVNILDVVILVDNILNP